MKERRSSLIKTLFLLVLHQTKKIQYVKHSFDSFLCFFVCFFCFPTLRKSLFLALSTSMNLEKLRWTWGKGVPSDTHPIIPSRQPQNTTRFPETSLPSLLLRICLWKPMANKNVRNLGYCSWKKFCTSWYRRYLIHCLQGFIHPRGWTGFLPSTVCFAKHLSQISETSVNQIHQTSSRPRDQQRVGGLHAPYLDVAVISRLHPFLMLWPPNLSWGFMLLPCLKLT